jgi:hypothetical protein
VCRGIAGRRSDRRWHVGTVLGHQAPRAQPVAAIAAELKDRQTRRDLGVVKE